MKILILTGKFGMGHYSTAEAVRQAITADAPDAQVTVVDIMDYMLPVLSRSVYGSFNFMVRYCSGLYNLLNTAAGRRQSVPFRRGFIHRMDQLIAQYEPDLLIATLPVCSQYISAYKSMRNCPIPFYTYITDITAHHEWIAPHTDLYFVGGEETKQELVACGVSEDRIVLSGIPVRQSFLSLPAVKAESRKITKLLIMGGGLGLIPSSAQLLQVLDTLPFVQTTIITGRNQKLYHKLTSKYPHIRVVGYTSQVNRYMQESDLVLTKSGGITTFEAIYCETPLYILTPFLMQETGNARYIEDQGIGKVQWDKNLDPGRDLLSLLTNTQALNQMKQNMASLKEEMAPVSPLNYYQAKEDKTA